MAVIGPNGDSPDVLYGNYQGTPPYLITPRMGLAAALGAAATVAFAPGCADVACANASGFASALALAQAPSTRAVVAVFGLDQGQEAEGHDRASLNLPGLQADLVAQLAAVAAARSIGFVLVLISGGPVNISAALADVNVPGIVLAGYASQSTGDALADVLLGRYAPAGKLAVSWFAGASGDLPDFADMGLVPNSTTGSPGRTYRHSAAKPLLPFGHGLTYTSWAYANAAVDPPPGPCDGASVSVTLRNTGNVDSSEVVQLYVSFDASARAPEAPYPAPQLALAGFERVFVAAGGEASVAFTLPPRSYARVNGTAVQSFGQDFAAGGPDVASGAAFGLDIDHTAAAAAAGKGAIGWDDLWAIVPGLVTVWVGSGQPGFGAAGLQTSFVVGGALTNLAACGTQ